MMTTMIVEDLHETGEWLKKLVSEAFEQAEVHLVPTIARWQWH